MAFKQGNTIQLTVDTGIAPTVTYTELICETTSEVAEAVTEIETTGKCSNGNKTLLGTGIYSFSIPVSGHYGENDPGVEQLNKALNAGLILFQWASFSGKTKSGEVQVTGFTTTAAHDGAVDFSATLSGSGELVWA